MYLNNSQDKGLNTSQILHYLVRCKLVRLWCYLPKSKGFAEEFFCQKVSFLSPLWSLTSLEAWLTHRDGASECGCDKTTHNPHGSAGWQGCPTHRTLFLLTLGLVFPKILILLLLSRHHTLIHWIVLSNPYLS